MVKTDFPTNIKRTQFSGNQFRKKPEEVKSCKHNRWDGYGLYVLINRRGYIKNDNPKIYRIYGIDGKWKKEVGEYYREEIDRSIKEGLRVELQNNEELINELDISIKSVKKRIEEHKIECETRATPGNSRGTSVGS
jgi:hypothetical protein